MVAEHSATKYDGYASGETLATAQWLEEHLHDPRVRVVEVDVSPAGYDAGHIDGAVLWNVYGDLKDGSYHLAGTAAIEDLLARSGISPDSTVVMYGYAPAMGLWLMKLYGHADVRLLDCAKRTWQRGRPAVDQCRSQPGPHPVSSAERGRPDPGQPAGRGGRHRRLGLRACGRAHRS